jgi:hypothetical protein
MSGQALDLCPRRVVRLAAPPERAPPEVNDVSAERRHGFAIGGHGVVVEVALNYPS